MTPDEKRALWGEGPWVDEPDRVEWKAHGFPCLVRRVSTFGHYCGYVAVPPGHPWHGMGTDNPLIDTIDAHGGINSAGPCRGDVCHVPEPGEPDDVYWLGFDACHGAIDLAPRMIALFQETRWPFKLTYRDLAYMRAECEALALQAQRAAQR